MSKIYNSYKQFGLFYLVVAIFKRLISPIARISSNYVLAIENHVPVKNNDDIQVIDIKNLDFFLKTNVKLSKQLKRQLLSFLPQNTIAIIIVRAEIVPGWGFVQQTNISKYAGYNYSIPEGTHLLKNLFVEPEFRGQSLGKRINKARINSIPEKITPTVFVIPSNKFAIRNLEMYGFRKQVFVKDYLCFNKYHARSLKVLGKKDIANLIITGFKDE